MKSSRENRLSVWPGSLIDVLAWASSSILNFRFTFLSPFAFAKSGDVSSRYRMSDARVARVVKLTASERTEELPQQRHYQYQNPGHTHAHIPIPIH